MMCRVLGLILLVGLCYAELPETIPDIDDFEVIKERCDKKGGAGTYDKIKTAGEEAQKCMKALIDVETFKTEVEEAKKTGSMEEVFGKYCGKRPQMRECIKKVYDAMQPCLEESEKNALNLTATIASQISDFACYRDGDRIAMFVAEGGVECLTSRLESIKKCVNDTVKFNPATFSPNSIPNLEVDQEKCDHLTSIQHCIVKDLEDHCSSTTPANVIDALFRFVKKLACKSIKPKRSISLENAIHNAIAITHEKYRELLEERLKATCEKNGGQGTYEDFKISLEESKNCYSKYRIFATPPQDYLSSLRNCSLHSRNAMKKCLREEERYYPDFIVEVIQELYGFIFRNIEKIIVNGQPTIEIANCGRALGQEEAQIKLFKCYNETSSDSSSEDSYTSTLFNVPRKSELCNVFTEVNNCISNVVRATCVKDIKITQIADDYVATMRKPCLNQTIEDGN